MPRLKPLPHIWLLSDARNDAALDCALRRLPRGSGLVFRHYHLPEPERRARFTALARIARRRGISVILSGSAQLARRWGADGSYGRHGDATLATAHSLRELARARRADAALLSPVFPRAGHRAGRTESARGSPAQMAALGGDRRLLHRADSKDFQGFLTRSRPPAHYARRMKGSMMATRGVSAGGRGAQVDWRATLRRAMRRAAEIGGAGLLLLAMVFLALALVSYHQTDPSWSTAAGGPPANWMGLPGAWVAERALFLFGPVSALFLPLLYVGARKLWRLVEEEDSDLPASNHAWWRPLGVLLFAMSLLGTVLALVFTGPGGSLPAGMGGFSGLLGARAIEGLATALLPEAGRFWAILGAGLACLAGGSFLAARVFALDWGSLLSLPAFLRRNPASADDAPIKLKPQAKPAPEPRPAPPMADDSPRKPPVITDPTRAAKPAQLATSGKQGDLFDNYELPPLDLLNDPPPHSKQKIDKLALERNARLLETVLDDFNVKGEITAVRTGPVVTMYELEPAPGIKASRVIGLADDIARNMSAISARVSSIPGRTVMGIELPNADRQMVSFKEMVASEAFAGSKGLLPIILGKDIAGEPVVADLATMPHLLVTGTTGSGKSAALPPDPGAVPPDPGRSQGP